jgi:hypothetical protein
MGGDANFPGQHSTAPILCNDTRVGPFSTFSHRGLAVAVGLPQKAGLQALNVPKSPLANLSVSRALPSSPLGDGHGMDIDDYYEF